MMKIANDEDDQNLQVNPLSANPTKWSNTLKQFVGNLLTNCLSVFNHFVGLALKGLTLKSGIKKSSRTTNCNFKSSILVKILAEDQMSPGII